MELTSPTLSLRERTALGPAFDQSWLKLPRWVQIVTAYDEEHIDTYLRLLNAAQDGASWREVSRLVLRVDPDLDAERARRMFDSHFTRAKWMTRN